MKIPFTKLATVLLGSIALAGQAATITGQINMAIGSVTLNPGNALGAVTSVNAGTAVVSSVEGTTYLPTLLLESVIHKGFTTSVGAQAISNLWTLTDTATGGGNTGNVFSFDLGSITVVTQTLTSLQVNGFGTLKATGKDDTPGLWSYNITSSDGSATNGIFSFQSNNVALPDGGSSLLLLGAALVGLVGIARKFNRLA